MSRAMRHPALLLRCTVAGLFLGAGGAASGSEAGEDEALSQLQAAYARVVVPGDEADQHRDLLATALRRIKRSHATEVDLAALSVTATKVVEPLPPAAGEPAEVFKKTMVEVLRTLDPQSRYIDPPSYDNQRAESSGGFGGLGMEVQAGEGAVRVVAPMPGGPAERAGIVSGDLIVRVDGQSLGGVALADAIAKMRGAPGTPVSITIQRAGADEFTVSLTRDIIRRQLLRWSFEGEALVLKLSSFSGAVETAVAQAVAEATAKAQPKAVVLDLRGNPGGLLREAVKLADAFLAQGEIVSLHGGASTRQRNWIADPGELLAGVPMVVLVDARSASASELVADALQFNRRATVMGQRSYGKGSVQTTYSLGENRGALKLTTSIYHGPSGETVHKVGVGPDVELLAPGKSASSAITPGSVPRQAARAKVDPARCPALTPVDPELACAVAYLRSGGVDSFLAAVAN